MSEYLKIPRKQIWYLIRIRIIHYWYKLRGLDLYLYDPIALDPQKNGLDAEKVHRSTPTDPFSLRRFIKKIVVAGYIDTKDIVDIGCGKGASLFMFDKCGFKNVVGIELNRASFNIAMKNFSNNNNITVYNVNAVEFTEYSNYSNYYLYNPFPCDVFEMVLNAILKARGGKNVNIIYFNDYCGDMLQSKGFVKVETDSDVWGCKVGLYQLQ